MADNTTLSTPSGSGDVIATDDIAGVKYPRSKLVIGADGTNDGDVSATNPLPVKGTGTAGAANAGVVTVQGIASMTALQVADNGGSLTVDDGAGSLTVDGSVGATQSGAWSVTADTELPAAAVLADNAANPTAPAVGAFNMAWDGVTWDRVPGTSVDGVRVDLGLNNDVTVTGPVTANAGTNLNTSLLALEAGGNLALSAASLSVLDDWDEVDRAKVNIIAGQAGVAAGAGLVGLTTQRATLASDDPAVVALQIIDDWDETDRAKVNLIAGQAGVAGGAGVVGATVQRTTLASDDPAVTALQVIDDIVKTEDAAHSTGDKGVMSLAIRKDSGVTLADLDGDYAPLQVDSSGALRVVATSSALPTGAATSANQATEISSLAAIKTAVELSDDLVLAEDAAHASGDKGLMPLAVRLDARATMVSASGDYSPLQLNSSGDLRVDNSAVTQPVSAASLPLPTGASTLTEQQSQTTALQLIDDVVQTEDAAHSTGHKGIMPLAVRTDVRASLVDFTGDYAALQLNASGDLRVDGSAVTQPVSAASLPLPTGGSTSALQTTGNTALAAIQTAVELLDNTVAGAELQVDIVTLPDVTAVGKVAHDGVAAGNPVLLGGYASTAAPAAVSADGDAVRLWATRTGAMVVADGGLTISVDDNAGSLTVDNAGTFPVQVDGAALTALQLIDDAVFAEDAASANADKGMSVLAVRQDTPANTSGLDGDYEHLKVSAGRLWASAKIDTALPTGTNNIGDVDVLTIAAGDNNIGNVDIVTMPDAVAVGKAAHDAVAAGNPVLLGGYASTASPVDVTADGDVAQLWTTRKGALNIADAGGSITVDASSLPLPTGASTLAEQQTQTTALQLLDDAVKTDDAAFTPATDKVLMIGAEFDDVAPDSVNEGDAGALRMSANRNVYVNIRDNAGNERGLSIDANGAMAATVTNATAANLNCTEASGVAIKTAVELIDNAVFVDDAVFTPATSSVIAVGFTADETATDSVNEGDVGAARMTLDRKLVVSLYPHTAGGLTMSKTISAATTNSTNVKGSAGQLYEIVCTNINAAPRYLKLYNKATSPTVGTDTPVWTLAIPGNTAGAGLAKTIPNGLEFTLGIGFALTTGVADADTGAVAANELVCNLGYR